jgi:two-component system alkaline phosphatase synthesis response regulator PhoP
MKKSSVPKILVVDDEPAICHILGEELSSQYSVSFAYDGEAALNMALKEGPDLVLLDFDMPNKNGRWFCEQYRKSKNGKETPIFVLSACVDSEKRLGLFDVGADDFIEKPFRLKELSAKIGARLKRSKNFRQEPRKVTLGNMVFDLEINVLHFGKQSVQLSKIEAEILGLFVQSPNLTFSRQKIMETLWGNTAVDEKTITVHMFALRQKIKEFDYQIKTVHGRGYVLIPKPASPLLNI